jgi:hypothetical protein
MRIRGAVPLLLLVLPASTAVAAAFTLSCTVRYGDQISDRVLNVDEATATVNGKPAVFEAGTIFWTETFPDQVQTWQINRYTGSIVMTLLVSKYDTMPPSSRGQCTQ